MPININNITHNVSANERKSVEQKSIKNNPIENDSKGKTHVASTATLQQDSVSLTGSSQQIRALEAQVARLPIIDTQKVEYIKNSISDGTFEFNASKIAEKFISYEKELA